MGIRGKDFVMVVADTTAVQQIITIKHDEEKIVPVDTDSPASSQKLLAMAGEPGDRVQVCHVAVLLMSHGSVTMLQQLRLMATFNLRVFLPCSFRSSS